MDISSPLTTLGIHLVFHLPFPFLLFVEFLLINVSRTWVKGDGKPFLRLSYPVGVSTFGTTQENCHRAVAATMFACNYTSRIELPRMRAQVFVICWKSR